MNIRIENLAAGVTVSEVKDALGSSDAIEAILPAHAGNSEDLVATVKLGTDRTGVAIADYRDGTFCKERRLSARAMTLLNE